VLSSGFTARLIWTGGHLAKSKIAFYVLRGKKRERFANWTDPAFYGGGTNLSRRPGSKLARFIRRKRSIRILVVWSSVTRTGLKASGRKTVTVKR
jgi:hypothetical protein